MPLFLLAVIAKLKIMKIIGAILGILLIGGGLVYFFTGDGTIDSCLDMGGCWDPKAQMCRKDEPDAQELCEGKIPNPPSVDDKPDIDNPTPQMPQRDFSFVKEIEFKNRNMIIDGVDQKLACSDNEDATQLGTLQLTDKIQVRLQCLDDYASGISVIYKNTKGENRGVLLEQAASDAGEDWDERSWMYRKGQDIFIDKVRVLSYEDEKEEKHHCDSVKTTYQWNMAKGEFVQIAEQENGPISNFTPPIQVEKDCLTAEGLWKNR